MEATALLGAGLGLVWAAVAVAAVAVAAVAVAVAAVAVAAVAEVWYRLGGAW